MSSCSKRCLLLLQKCLNMNQLKQAHALVFTSGLGSNSFALSRLLDFCADPRHGSLSHASKLFQHIQHPTVCICNTMIKAFLLRGEFLTAIVVYSVMLRNGIAPDSYTHPSVLKACARMKDFRLGESVHACTVKFGFVSDVFVGNSLLVMYCAFGNMRDAGQVFDEMPELSVVSWTVMIYGYAKMGDVNAARGLFDMAPIKDRGIWGAMLSGYVQNSCFKEGLHLFRLMQLAEVQPDEAIIVTILCACAQMGALDTGIWIHRYLGKLGFPLTQRVCTGLIDMYSKCGHLDLARYVFDEMPQRDTIVWNAMISGMAMHDGEGALKLFDEMEKARIKLDDITFIAILSACSNSGMANEGLKILNRMSTIYKIEPKSEHYGCIIDLLSRAGRFEEAERVIQRLPNAASTSEEAAAWRAYLSACCKHEQMQQAEVAAQRLFQLERHSGAYVLLSNLYGALGKHEDAKRVRKMMKLKGVEKVPGCSSIKVNGVVNEFIAGDKTHHQIGNIHLLLKKLNKQIVQGDHQGLCLSVYSEMPNYLVVGSSRSESELLARLSRSPSFVKPIMLATDYFGENCVLELIEKAPQSLSNCRTEVCKALEISEEQCEISMGMSPDFEQAVEMGLTNVRVGSTYLGRGNIPRKSEFCVLHLWASCGNHLNFDEINIYRSLNII